MTSPPAVLVIPGLDGFADLLQGVQDRLFDGMKPVFYDHRADRAEGGVEGMAGRALAVADEALEPDAPLLVCGESFGGTVALTLAHLYPERVSGLILLSAFARYPSTGFGHLGVRSWSVLGDRVADPMIRVGRRVGFVSQLGLRHSRASRRAFFEQPFPDLPAYRAKSALSVSFDARPWLSEITCPSLVLTGTLDLVVPTSAGRDLALRLPNSCLRQLPGGHIAHMVHPIRANDYIRAWMADQNG